ncbi:MAG: GAF domain-containing protein [Chloroflexota bacterium]|jgi:GAF domain-containing protein
MDTQTNTTQPAATRRIPAWLEGWKFPWAAAAGLYLLVFTSWILFKWTDPAYEELIAGLGYLPLGFFAAVSASLTARQSDLDLRTRRAWRFLALSLFSLVIGDILYTAIDLTKGVGFPDIPDIFYLVFYPLAFAGIVSIPTLEEDPALKRTHNLDLVITMTSVTGILWYFIIAPTAAAGGETWLAKWVAGAYPGMDALLLASIISLILQRNHPGARQALFILALGMSAYILADIIYAGAVLQETYTSGSPVDALWSVSYYFIGISALRQTDTRTNIPSAVKPVTVWQSAVLSITALIASVLVSLYAATSGKEPGIPAYGLFVATALTVFLTIARQIFIIADNTRLIEKLSAASQQLQANAENLEIQVAQRTQELQNQTNKLYLVSQIARDIAATSNLESLLQLTATSLSARFQVRHAGIYLLDNKREFAVPVSASSPTGKQRIAEGYKLPITGADFIARTASTGEPTLASTSDLPTAPDNQPPLLPDTRSALALPLKVANRTIGVLDLQSNQPQAFQRGEDTAILQIIADQIGIAIERARLLEQVEENLKELQRAYGETTREKWRALVETGLLEKAGYRFDNVRIQPLQEMPEAGEEALRAGSPIVQAGSEKGVSQPAKVAVPIKLRGQPIGVVSLKLRENYNPNTIKTITLAVERLASALESARLFEEARLKAEREQAISQVTSAISSASEFDAILRTTVEEIGRSLGDAEVSIQLTEQAE